MGSADVDSATARRFKPVARIAVWIGIALVLSGAGYLIDANTKLHRALVLGTTRQPEAFTALSFNNPQKLPRLIAVDKAASFSFHIVNHEPRVETYYYTVVAKFAAGLKPITAGLVFLAPGAGINKSVSFEITNPKETTEIVVNLVDRSQHIDFWSTSS